MRIELPEDQVRFVIPKFHFAGHKQKDHNQLSLNLTTGSARTDGEANERFWSKNNAIASSTREMGPGGRQDVIEDQFGSINWQNRVALGTMKDSPRVMMLIIRRATYQEAIESRFERQGEVR